MKGRKVEGVNGLFWKKILRRWGAKALRGYVVKVVKTLGRKDDKFVTFKKAIRLQGDKTIRDRSILS